MSKDPPISIPTMRNIFCRRKSIQPCYRLPSLARKTSIDFSFYDILNVSNLLHLYVQDFLKSIAHLQIHLEIFAIIHKQMNVYTRWDLFRSALSARNRLSSLPYYFCRVTTLKDQIDVQGHGLTLLQMLTYVTNIRILYGLIGVPSCTLSPCVWQWWYSLIFTAHLNSQEKRFIIFWLQFNFLWWTDLPLPF